jgi:hypothetical protein
MMAIRRFRFALLLALVLAVSVIFVSEGSAFESLVQQVLPDENGDFPSHSAAGGSSGPQQNERGSIKATSRTNLLDGAWICKDSHILKMLWLKVIGLVL